MVNIAAVIAIGFMCIIFMMIIIYIGINILLDLRLRYVKEVRGITVEQTEDTWKEIKETESTGIDR